MHWYIYYADQEPWQGAVEEAPERGVQAIVQEDPDLGWHALSCCDYYIWIGDRWLGVDVFGLWDYLASPGWKRVLFGRTIRNEEYVAIYRRALADMGAKSSHRVSERIVR